MTFNKKVFIFFLFNSYCLLAQDLTQEEQLALLYERLAFRNSLFCGSRNGDQEVDLMLQLRMSATGSLSELAACKHTVDDLMEVVLLKKESLVPKLDVQNVHDFQEWLSQQENSLLMVSKPSCVPCVQAHAYFSAYLADNALQSKVFSIDPKFAHALAEQGVAELVNVAHTPKFFLIKHGKIVENIPNLDPIALRRYVGQNLSNSCES